MTFTPMGNENKMFMYELVIYLASFMTLFVNDYFI